MSFEIGQKVRVSLVVTNDDGVPTNATVAVSVMHPNLTAAAAPVAVNDSTGNYHFDVTPDAVPGPWQWTATTSGAVVSVQRGQFWVRDPAMQLISLEEMKTHLNKALDVHTDDEELRDWIEAGRWVIEREVGPVLPRTITETYDGYRRVIVLRQGPVIGVTSVTETVGPQDIRVLTAETPPTYGENQYAFDAARRLLTRRSFGWSGRWAESVAVTYMVGRYPLPMNYKVALGELVSHLWRASQLTSGGSRPNVNAPDAIPTGYAVPNRVRELLGRRRAPRLGG